MPAKRVLVTGFEPYGGHARNPSEAVARLLDGIEIGGAEVAGRVLPVIHAGLAARIEALIDETAPRAVICLGLDPGEESIRLERVATNVLDFEIADNAGAVLRGPVVADAEDVLRSTLPLAAIERGLKAASLPVRCSDDAGRFVCNALMYHALFAAQRRRPPPACGFVHLPMPAEQAGDGAALPLARMAEAVRITVAATLDAA